MNRTVKKISLFVLVMAVVAVGGWYGRKAYKKSTERNLLNQARHYVNDKDWRNTALCLQRVLQINPMSADASRMMGDLLESGGSPAALSWRIRTAKLQPDNPTNYFAWAQTALKNQELQSAIEALSSVDEKSKSTASYHKLAGAAAWSSGQPADAEKQYLEAMHLEPANPANALNLATVRLASTNEATVAAARTALEQIPPGSDLRLTALRHLVNEADARKAWLQAIAYSSEIVSNTAATFADKITHLQMLRETGHAEAASWLASLKDIARRSTTDAFALGRWMAVTETPAGALSWLHSLPPTIQTNQPVPLIITDCQIATKDWKNLLVSMQKQDWGEAEFYRLAVESLALRSLDQTTASENAWRKALRLTAHRVDRLSRLAQVTATWNWNPERTEVLRQITSEFPHEKWAVNQLSAQLYASGNTRELQDFLTKVHSADPSDIRLKNNLANVFLLRKSELDQAYRMAKEVYDSSPTDPFFISTYAYSLLLQNKQDAALEVASHLKPQYLKIPSVAAYYGVIQAQFGNKNAAKESLSCAETAKLLPEEKEMVRLAKARL